MNKQTVKTYPLKTPKKNPKDFLFEADPKGQDIDDLADNLFEALYDHTNK